MVRTQRPEWKTKSRSSITPPVDVRERSEIGARIAQARRESGVTQAELARALGVTVRSVQNWEAGSSVPYRHLRAIESVTHRRPGWLLDGSEQSALDQKLSELHEAIEAHRSAMELHLRLMREHTERLREQRLASEGRRAGSGRRQA